MSFYNKEMADLMSVACHYNDTVVIGKNGELIQILKVDFNNSPLYEKNQSNLIPNANTKNAQENSDFRDLLIKSIKEINEYEKYSISCYLVNDYFDGQERLKKVLYIAIIYKGLKEKLGILGLSKLFIASKDKKEAHLEALLSGAVKEIESTTSKIIEYIQDFDPSMLGISRKADLDISEIFSFYYYIVHFVFQDVPLSEMDASVQISSNTLSRYYDNGVVYVVGADCRNSGGGGNDGSGAIDVNEGSTDFIDEDERGMYVAMYTLKQRLCSNRKAVARIHSMNSPFILSEHVILSRESRHLEKFKSLQDVYIFNNDKFMKEAFDFPSLSSGDKYCEHQINLTVFSAIESGLRDACEKISRILIETGLNMIREDVYLGTLLSSLVPGNIHYVKRSLWNSIENSLTFL